MCVYPFGIFKRFLVMSMLPPFGIFKRFLVMSMLPPFGIFKRFLVMSMLPLFLRYSDCIVVLFRQRGPGWLNELGLWI